MKCNFGPLELHKNEVALELQDAADVFQKLRDPGKPSFLLESRSINPLYGRMSLLGIDPVFEVRGEGEACTLRLLQERGQVFFDALRNNKDFLSLADEVLEHSEKSITLRISKDEDFLEEGEKTKRKNIAAVLRFLIALFVNEDEELLGLFGAFSYDFVRLFESLPDEHPSRGVPDFHFFLFDTFVRFDLLRERASLLVYRENESQCTDAIEQMQEKIQQEAVSKIHFSTKDVSCDGSREHYEDLVQKAKELARQGELFEVVFSREFSGTFSGDPFALYRIYREKNPAPYLFFFDFGDSQLVGASPEMMVRVENGTCHLRPISGTRPRGKDPISDHEHELELLSCEKERAELDMLIDLGRNDLKRVCESGIEITSYRHVEKYSRVMHTIAHLTGKLKKNMTALDALIACQSAGTLTGAPKVQAMKEIEQHESSRRGLYGGSVGYLTFSGNMDTGIIIRSAHIQDGRFCFRVGATLLHDSLPEDEYKEVENKAKALLDILEGG